MLAKLKAIFQSDFAEDDTGENKLHLACAALMTEVATIDNNFEKAESDALIHALKQQLSLSDSAAQDLAALAEQTRDEATSLHQFTREVNEHFSPEEKFKLLQAMWAVAYADGHLDKYEELIIRRAADLLHLGHSQFIQAKLAAKP